MSREFTFADPGEGIHEGEIIEIHVDQGDEIDEGDTILTVETDKAATEIPSPYTATVQDIPVEVGDIVEIGQVLMVFSGDEDARTEEEPAGEEEEEGAAAVGEVPEDEQEAVETQPAQPSGADGPVPASPATRRLARELDVDLRTVDASGPHGRVTAEDVRAAAEAEAGEEEAPERPEEEEAVEEGVPAREPGPAPLPDLERWGSVERIPLRGVRRTVARRLAVSWRRVPHVTHHDVADVTELERFRRERAPQIEEAGGDLSLMIVVMKAVVGQLERYPRFNAALDEEADEIVLRGYYHIGIAVDTDDGLIVPVVRDVDEKPLADLAVEVSELIERVRAREVDREELQGGTFTVTNVGPLGGTAFTPLIRHPEVAILGMARTRLEPVVTGDLDRHETEVRLRLPLSLTFDHRVNDGADAARFTSDLIDALSDPESLLLNI